MPALPVFTRPRLIAGVWVALSLGVLGTQSLFARPSYEMALAAGVLVPVAVAIATAAELSRRELDGLPSYARALSNGASLAGLALLVALLHGLRNGFCDLLAGLYLFALGPFCGCLLAGVWGVFAAELARRLVRAPRWRRRLSWLLALAGPLGSALLQLLWFYHTPMIFAYDPFAGFFSGAIFDTVLSYTPLLAYRAASLATLFSCYALASHLKRDARGRLLVLRRGRPGLATLGVLAAAASLISVGYGSQLDHWHTRGTIARELGAELRYGRCLVLYDRHLERAHVQRLAQDCHQHVLGIEQLLGGGDGRIVTAYLFANTDDKRRFMGAAGTSVAKPWRSEIYLHDLPYPHRIMRHELVHVIAGAHGRGPFQIAGELGGWLPNPGLIEGIAEAAAPRDDNLSAHQWAAAMRKIDLLPRIQGLLSLAFFGNHSSTSYLAAGSFVSWIQQTYGSKLLSDWYGGGSLVELTGSSWDQLEQNWWLTLDAIKLDDAAIEESRRRFDRPSLFARRCPHVVDKLLIAANGSVGGGDVDGAAQRYEHVLRLDQGNLSAMFGLARCHERRAEPAAARGALAQIAADERLTLSSRMLASERLADLLLRQGQNAEAVALYQQVRASVSDEGRLRSLDIKRHYAHDELARAALVALLIGRDERGPNLPEALDRLGQWRSERPSEAMPAYLFARQYFNDEHFQLAAEKLDVVIAAEGVLPRVYNEALWLRVISACALADHAAAQAHLKRYQERPDTLPQRRSLLADTVARCTAPPPQGG